MQHRRQKDYHHTDLARNLRHEQTEAEQRLWSHLRNRHLDNAKFRRQVPLGKYVLDFVCYEHKLCVELDGSHHAEPEIEGYDAERTAFIESQGLRVIRFPNHVVIKNTEGVLNMIHQVIVDPEHFDDWVERFDL